MESTVYEETLNGLTIKIYQDESGPDPRKDYDNLGTMICFHRDYKLGDEHTMTPDELVELVKRKDVIALPLFLLDHSGLWMRTGRFECDSGGWDTSRLGYIYVDYATIRKEYGKVTKTTKQKALEVLELEVKIYSAYLEGSVYGFVIEDQDGENLDSVWGFIETDFPIEKTYVLQEARSTVQALTHNGTTDADGQLLIPLEKAG